MITAIIALPLPLLYLLWEIAASYSRPVARPWYDTAGYTLIVWVCTFVLLSAISGDLTR